MTRIRLTVVVLAALAMAGSVFAGELSLADAIEIAFANNPQVTAAQAEVEVTEHGVRAAGSASWPTLAVNGSYGSFSGDVLYGRFIPGVPGDGAMPVDPYDRNATAAVELKQVLYAGGAIDAGLLKAMLADGYFGKAPPKSTGTEHFNLAWINAHAEVHGLDPADVQCTLAELTAVTVRDAIVPSDPGDVLVCGGGVHNDHLLSRIRAHLPGVPVRSTARAGLEPDWVEAVLFAWLARERLAQRPQDTRGVTGAHNPVLLGTIEGP